MGSQDPGLRFNVRRIAIIGAGPAGLASARYLLGQGTFDHIAIFEQQAEVGGVWNYSKEPSNTLRVPQTSPLSPPDLPVWPDDDQASPPLFPTPMYDDLNTNIPHTLMNFSDLPFPQGSIIFPPREDVQQYLVASSQPVRDLIRFCTKVTSVQLRQGSDSRDRWDVTTLGTQTGDVKSSEFDAVVVANGHYALPYIPDIEGIRSFHERHPTAISHSKTYRSPAPFAGKKVVVVGNAASGLDIARQIHGVCRHPLLISTQSPTPAAQLEHTGAEEVPEIEAFLPDNNTSVVMFKGGRVEDVDAVLFCTGYLFSYPFMDTKALGNPPLVHSGRRVQGLYQHLFHIRHPTLVFPGLLIKAVPFPVCEVQAAVFSRVWSNMLELPAEAEMMDWEQKTLQERGESMHVLPTSGDTEYINQLHDWAMQAPGGGKEPPKWEGEMVWQRNTYKDAKLAFEKHGKKAKSLDEIGFAYDPTP